jgi:dihydrodipicolinate synthase/N-acetylneuraminate lyase
MKPPAVTPVTHPVTMMQYPALLTGVVAPLFTPERADGRIDFDGIEAEVDFLCQKSHVHALIVRSGPGRMWTYTRQDVRDAIRVAVAAARGRRPVLANCAGIWNGDPGAPPRPAVYRRDAIELSEWAISEGAAAVVQPVPTPLLLDPEYPAAEVAFRFFEDYASATQVPTLLYNQTDLPASASLTTAQLARLSRRETFVGAIYNTTDVAVLGDLVRCCRPNFAIGTGNDAVASSAFIAGVTLSGGPLATLVPEILHGSWQSLHDNDNQLVFRSQRDLLAAFSAMSGWAVWDIGCAILQRFGVGMAPRSRDALRPPLPEETELVARELGRLKLAYL